MKKYDNTDKHDLSFWQFVLLLCCIGGVVTFMAKTGYDPFPICTCGELATDSTLQAMAAQGDTLVNEYLETESSDLMCAARKKELLKKLKERATNKRKNN